MDEPIVVERCKCLHGWLDILFYLCHHLTAFLDRTKTFKAKCTMIKSLLTFILPFEKHIAEVLTEPKF